MQHQTNGHSTGLDLDANDESVEEQRLKEIFQRKREATNTRDEARRAVARNTAAEREGLSAYRSAIEAYISAIQPLLNQGGGPHLWQRKEYGTITFQPPGESTRNGWQLPDGQTTPTKPDPKVRQIVGLQTLFAVGDPLQEAFEITTGGRHQHTQTHTVTASQQLGWGILDSMLIDLNNILHSAGLSINEATDNEADADYSDIL
jgi:hypothetical protein